VSKNYPLPLCGKEKRVKESDDQNISTKKFTLQTIMAAELKNEFEGKVVLVTGGSRGIGGDIVKKFAQSGAIVAFSYSSSAEKAKALEEEVANAGVGKAVGVKTDHSVSQESEDLVKQVIDKFGRLDVLVNNAGIALYGAIGEDKEETFDKVFDVNVKGVWATTNAAVKVLPDGGRIINIGSIVGEKVIGPNMGIYAASKFAVQGLTRGWARDLGSRKITVNLIQPGATDTDMNPDVPENPFTGFFKGITPLGRYGKVEDVSAAVMFLASSQSSFITGAVLNVDGGVLA
jgi:3-oxoacyl-[acyl-carrier protein] reductase